MSRTGRAGLLWFDDDPGVSFEEKVGRAVATFRKKHSYRGECTCYVNPATANGVTLPGVVEMSCVLKDHYWVVPEDDSVYTEEMIEC